MPKRNVYELDNNKKVYTTTELRALGYAQYAITKMLALGMIEKISSSVYENVNYNGPDSDFYYVSPLMPVELFVCFQRRYIIICCHIGRMKLMWR